MAIQEIKLGDLWDLVFEKINANFTELFESIDGAVTEAALTERLTAYMTMAAFNEQIAAYITNNQLTETLADYVTSGRLTQELASYVTANALNNTLSTYVTNSMLTDTLAHYVTSTALTAAITNKVDKEEGKGLSTNDYTTADKNKLAALTAPTKHEFTAGSWGTADAGGVYSMSIPANNQNVVAVFRANGSAFENAAVAISMSGNTATIRSEETFAGYAVLV